MIINEKDIRHESILDAARLIMTAARTAPKARGIDVLEIILIEGEEIKTLSETLHQLGEERNMEFMLRDAHNILYAEAILLIGTKQQVLGLNCAYCGYSVCADKPEAIPCAINSIDVGIAVGSACSKAADLRVDSRVMFSAGYAAQHIGWLPDCRSILALPLTASSKNPFFDRK